MDLVAARHLADELMAKHGLAGRWKFGFDRAERRMGVCSYRSRRITLSRSYVTAADEAMVRETVLHEIAHALAFEQHPGARVGHGPEWKRIAERIGCAPTATGRNPAFDAREADRQASALATAHSFPAPVDGIEAGRLDPGARVVLDAPLSPRRGDVFVILRATRNGFCRAIHVSSGKQFRLHQEQFRLHVVGEPLDRVNLPLWPM